MPAANSIATHEAVLNSGSSSSPPELDVAVPGESDDHHEHDEERAQQEEEPVERGQRVVDQRLRRRGHRGGVDDPPQPDGGAEHHGNDHYDVHAESPVHCADGERQGSRARIAWRGWSPIVTGHPSPVTTIDTRDKPSLRLSLSIRRPVGSRSCGRPELAGLEFFGILPGGSDSTTRRRHSNRCDGPNRNIGRYLAPKGQVRGSTKVRMGDRPMPVNHLID